jgi:hypothetical protein
MHFDWHGGNILRTTMVDANYKNTQNVRRFMTQECGEPVKFNRDFMAWIVNGQTKNMGDVADEWLRQQRQR